MTDRVAEAISDINLAWRNMRPGAETISEQQCRWIADQLRAQGLVTDVDSVEEWGTQDWQGGVLIWGGRDVAARKAVELGQTLVSRTRTEWAEVQA